MDTWAGYLYSRETALPLLKILALSRTATALCRVGCESLRAPVFVWSNSLGPVKGFVAERTSKALAEIANKISDCVVSQRVTACHAVPCYRVIPILIG